MAGIYLTIRLFKAKCSFVGACNFQARTETFRKIPSLEQTRKYKTTSTKEGYLLRSGIERVQPPLCLLGISARLGRGLLRDLKQV